MTIGIDTGGTFTDLIFHDGRDWVVRKVLSTPDNPAQAVLAGLGEITSRAPFKIVHGSTVATNAILERKGVKTALVSNKGFTDVLAIGRQNRSRLYDLAYRKEPPLVPEELRFDAPGRIDHAGAEVLPFDESEALATVDKISRSGAESVAVAFIFSFANPDHELKMGRLLERLDLPVSLSHRILSEFREYERTSTTVVNAYVAPRMEKYISYLMDRLRPGEALSIMQSNGGSISAETAMREPVRTILSGPAGGVVGALAAGRRAGRDRLVAFDMGGTSTDVSLIDGRLPLALETTIGGCPIKTPLMDIHTIGSGGGSIAYLDHGGALRVGPESAGADPGPICYGRGRSITVTDANLFLGRLIPNHFLGGGMKLHPELLPAAFHHLAARTGLSPLESAEGVLAVVEAQMERALRVISVERGHDPREFTLLSFGGAGGLHAANLARRLSMPRVMAPPHPGALSAFGMLAADIIKDYSQTVMLKTSEVERHDLDRLLAPLKARGIRDLVAEGLDPAEVIIEPFLDMRYEGQSHELVTPLAADFERAFHLLHEKTYGYRNEGKPVQIVNLRLRARGAPARPAAAPMKTEGPTPPEAARLGPTTVIFEGRPLKAEVLQREALRPGNRFRGPAVVVEYSSTLFAPPFAAAEVDGFGNIVLEIS
ncbi:MAG: hydantoinase/oxoprolinase family protein [Pseudomonadota bacterium]